MTAEIAVMNKQAVALAADSAVTIGVEQKIYNSANKLFMLSKYEPVGAMVYGGAEFMGVPWETILKCYRSELGETCFDTLEEYGEDLLRFLRTSDTLFPPDRKCSFIRGILSVFLDEIRMDLEQAVKSMLATRGTLSDQDVVTAFEECLSRVETRLRDKPLLDDSLLQQQEQYVRAEASALSSLIFEQLPLTASHTERLACLCWRRIVADDWSRNHTGVVIAGFGRKAVFPSIRDYLVELAVGDALRWKQSNAYDVSDGDDACIIPFAQGDMVAAFMEGADRRYRSFAEGQIDTLFKAMPEELVQGLVREGVVPEAQVGGLRESLQEDLQALLKRFKEDLTYFQHFTFVKPTIDVVGVLPKDELAEMAETLVSLTSFKRRMSMDVETVGGPVDVAVISKGDGFIWVKRKHYFQPELNHGFFSKYYPRGDA